ncbi:MAG: hypothetical protein ACLR7D_12660 [Lachnospira eligens]
MSHYHKVSSMLKKIRKIIIMHSQDKSMMLHWQMGCFGVLSDGCKDL